MAKEEQKFNIITALQPKTVIIETVEFQTDMNQAQAFEFVEALKSLADDAKNYNLQCENNAEENSWAKRHYSEKWSAAYDIEKVFSKWLEEHKTWSADYKPEEEDGEDD